MTRCSRWMTLCSALLLAAGCDDGPPPNTGGTSADRGILVVNTDFAATNVSLVGLDGSVLSPSFYSSSSPLPGNEGSTAALSADVVVPTMPQAGDRLVLIDRHFGVLSWVDRATGKLDHLLRVGPNVPLNLQDYAEISPRKAYVPNLDPKLDPGLGAVERGSNLVIVDPGAPAILGAVDLTPAMDGDDPGFYPRPTRVVLVGERAHLLLAPATQYFDKTAVARIVTLDTKADAIVSVTKLDGLHNCTGLALSPSAARLAVTCSGTFHTTAAGQRLANLGEAGVVVLSLHDGALTEEKRWSAEEIGKGPPGFSASFATEDRLTFPTFGELGDDGKPTRGDTLLTLDLGTSAVETTLDVADAFVIGETRCVADAGLCFVAEANQGGRTLHRFTVQNGALGADRAITVDPEHGLPPRYLGQF
ncbi:MAG: hypothetical protein U0359_07200 [Byssovorax sp.]